MRLVVLALLAGLAPAFAHAAPELPGCVSPQAKRVMLIAVTPKALTASTPTVSPDGSQVDDASLVCVLFGRDSAGRRINKQLEFVGLVNGVKEVISFADLVSKGRKTVRDTPLGKVIVSKITCPECKETDTRVTLRIEMLTTYVLVFGKNRWASMNLEVELPTDRDPQAYYKGHKFDVLSLRSWKSRTSGGIRTARFSECVSDRSSCLKEMDPAVKHGQIFEINDYGRY